MSRVFATTVEQRAAWLPAGKTAAICFSIDDVHPATSLHPYEAGGDLQQGALGRLVTLQRTHRDLKLTLCVTPNWRLKSLAPGAADRLHQPDLFRLDRHPRFVAYLNGLDRSEVVVHGLTHSHPGERFAVEFQDQTVDECCTIVRLGLEIFAEAGLNFVRGYMPPSWNAPPALVTALERMDFEFLSSARDVQTEVSFGALTHMSGLHGVSLIYPEFVGNGRLVHVSCNFQATSPLERALAIIDAGGVLYVKAHIFKAAAGHVMLDGLDDEYCAYLDALFSELNRRYGNALWWAQLSEIAARVRAA